METTVFDYEGFFIFLGIVAAFILLLYCGYKAHKREMENNPRYKEEYERRERARSAKRIHRKLTGFHTYKYKGPTGSYR